jgi:molybdate transport system substrate-binding protein
MPNAIRLLSTLALKGAVERLASQYQATAGTTLDADYAPTVGLLKRLRGGEQADVLILTREGLSELVAEGAVASESRRKSVV